MTWLGLPFRAAPLCVKDKGLSWRESDSRKTGWKTLEDHEQSG